MKGWCHVIILKDDSSPAHARHIVSVSPHCHPVMSRTVKIQQWQAPLPRSVYVEGEFRQGVEMVRMLLSPLVPEFWMVSN